jgi:16S rRNA processing protein RimM
VSTQELICVGKLLSPHGVRGEIKFLCYLEDPRPLRKAKTLFDANGKAYDLESVRTAPKERLLLKLKGLETPEDALLYKNQELFAPRTLLPAPLQDEYYYHDLVGMRAVTSDGHHTFHVIHVHNFGAGDILELEDISDPTKRYMIPFRGEAVWDVNQETKSLIVSEHFMLDDHGKIPQ